MKKRYLHFKKNLGRKAIILTVVFLLFFFISISALLRDNNGLFLMSYTLALIIPALFRQLFVEYYKIVTKISDAFVLICIIVGILTRIDAVDGFVQSNGNLIMMIISIMAGLCISSLFWIYSDPSIEMMKQE